MLEHLYVCCNVDEADIISILRFHAFNVHGVALVLAGDPSTVTLYHHWQKIPKWHKTWTENLLFQTE